MYSSSHIDSYGVSSNRLEALREKHAYYKSQIEEARKQPSTTDFYLAQLKKQKLAIKEEMAGLRTVKRAS